MSSEDDQDEDEEDDDKYEERKHLLKTCHVHMHRLASRDADWIDISSMELALVMSCQVFIPPLSQTLNQKR